MTKIGIFPLNIVLFPGSSYPLHIFESRYKILINETIAAGSELGINLVLVEDGKMFQVGCMARVSEVITTYEDGKMDIVVSGTRRYMISEYRNGERPYLVAETSPYDDTDPIPDPLLLESTITLYNQLVETVYGGAEETLDPGDWSKGGGAFRIAQKSGLDLVLRQQLLEMRSEDERLRFLTNYLDDIVPRIRQIEQIQMLTRNDGYVRRTS
jgi:Lon protease-like protein